MSGAKPPLESGQRENTVLQEVAIEGEGMGDPKPIHRREAKGIGKRKGLVVVASDNLACSTFILQGDANYSGRTAIDLLEDAKRSEVTESIEDESMRLGEDEVGGEEAPTLTDQPLLDGHSGPMGILTAVDQRIVRRAINKRPAQ